MTVTGDTSRLVIIMLVLILIVYYDNTNAKAKVIAY